MAQLFTHYVFMSIIFSNIYPHTVPKAVNKKTKVFYVSPWQALIVFRIIELRFYAVSNSCYAYFTLCHVRKLLSDIHDILPHPRLENLGYPPPVKLTFDSPDLPVTDSYKRKATFYTFCAIKL